MNCWIVEEQEHTNTVLMMRPAQSIFFETEPFE
jgi:hypothetical protein